ncbi:dienelactone hydrolase family protein [Priestia taiwanensis]|uniref:Dienelactone hydrolase domain-containing protein n=1 Tax=Priestia taiwanensis TaxID=1347902 RepID=A0A917ENE5_9BACI|nr:dienelactone hydrolase family protein [Priestia taiwanensis]MBM7362503.1 dienelactone hydrolase [Priestia taiwanensis]GGE62756.1 hypothetical protein GCM10007140_11270 [Priestia taiwanensis]
MLSYINNQKKLVIVLHEIYGINDHIKSVAEQFVQQSYDVICPNFLAVNQIFSYEAEEVAYCHFMTTCSFEDCARQVDELVRGVAHKYEFIAIIGFSVGATVAWLCSTHPLCDVIVGFYGSRIRNYLSIEPACNTLLLLPSEEPSFSVQELIHNLSEKEGVYPLQLEGKHGFADSYSPCYHEGSASIALEKMKAFLESC